ncbi:MAG: MFS transporter [Gammaproteobacteria bacterium]|nr:MFS transporter [Gammaproteobacteria bacterium]
MLQEKSEDSSHSQFQLLKENRFRPFFLTQFFGAFNDNVFKNALFILIAFQSSYAGSTDSTNIINLAAILFIAPFLLFSAIAGQIADRYEKSSLIRRIKLAEICIMLVAAFGFYFQIIPLLLFALFSMGMQSSLFGPIKYSIIPQHLKKDELVGGNALVETATFGAILLGTMLGGILIGLSAGAKLLIPFAMLTLAMLGFLSSIKIPLAPAVDPNLKLKWNTLSETFNNLGSLRENRTVFNSVLGVSWFWFLGSTYITQLPNFTRLSLGANEQVVTFFLALFCIGIGIGSLTCERLSNRTIELGLVPVGSIGLTIFGADLFFATTTHTTAELIGFKEFIYNQTNWRLILDILLLGVFGGIYIVPLYALIQARSNPKRRSRIIAGNNILNALFIIVAGIYAIALTRAGLSIPQLFLIAAILNAVVAIYIYTLIPEFFMRFVVWILVHLVYRIKKVNLDNIPEEGAAIVACNHVSLMDALIIGGCVRRPIRFVMYHKVFNIPFLRFIFKTANAIPIAPKKEDPELLEQAYSQIASELQMGNVVGIFPEGKLTLDGEINDFKTGIERILKETPVPVVPIALEGMWGSFFSNKHGKPLSGIPRRLLAKIKITAAKPLSADQASAASLQKAVSELLN